jgi:hypothetical protein
MKILVWGTGAAAEEFFTIAAVNDIEIVACIDNNCRLWGKEFHGRPILSPAELSPCSCDRLVICSTFHEAIKRQIERCLRGLPARCRFTAATMPVPWPSTNQCRCPTAS